MKLVYLLFLSSSIQVFAAKNKKSQNFVTPRAHVCDQAFINPKTPEEKIAAAKKYFYENKISWMTRLDGKDVSELGKKYLEHPSDERLLLIFNYLKKSKTVERNGFYQIKKILLYEEEISHAIKLGKFYFEAIKTGDPDLKNVARLQESFFQAVEKVPLELLPKETLIILFSIPKGGEVDKIFEGLRALKFHENDFASEKIKKFARENRQKFKFLIPEFLVFFSLDPNTFSKNRDFIQEMASQETEGYSLLAELIILINESYDENKLIHFNERVAKFSEPESFETLFIYARILGKKVLLHSRLVEQFWKIRSQLHPHTVDFYLHLLMDCREGLQISKKILLDNLSGEQKVDKIRAVSILMLSSYPEDLTKEDLEIIYSKYREIIFPHKLFPVLFKHLSFDKMLDFFIWYSLMNIQDSKQYESVRQSLIQEFTDVFFKGEKLNQDIQDATFDLKEKKLIKDFSDKLDKKIDASDDEHDFIAWMLASTENELSQEVINSLLQYSKKSPRKKVILDALVTQKSVLVLNDLTELQHEMRRITQEGKGDVDFWKMHLEKGISFLDKKFQSNEMENQLIQSIATFIQITSKRCQGGKFLLDKIYDENLNPLTKDFIITLLHTHEGTLRNSDSKKRFEELFEGKHFLIPLIADPLYLIKKQIPTPPRIVTPNIVISEPIKKEEITEKEPQPVKNIRTALAANNVASLKLGLDHPYFNQNHLNQESLESILGVIARDEMIIPRLSKISTLDQLINALDSTSLLKAQGAVTVLRHKVENNDQELKSEHRLRHLLNVIKEKLSQEDHAEKRGTIREGLFSLLLKNLASSEFTEDDFLEYLENFIQLDEGKIPSGEKIKTIKTINEAFQKMPPYQYHVKINHPIPKSKLMDFEDIFSQPNKFSEKLSKKISELYGMINSRSAEQFERESDEYKTVGDLQEGISIAVVMESELKEGWTPFDVSGDGRYGFDVLSINFRTGEKRHIEAKSKSRHSTRGQIKLSDYQIQTAKEMMQSEKYFAVYLVDIFETGLTYELTKYEHIRFEQLPSDSFYPLEDERGSNSHVIDRTVLERFRKIK